MSRRRRGAVDVPRHYQGMRPPLFGVIWLAAVGACEPCGPPAEPLIEVTTSLDPAVAPRPDAYLFVQMLNGASEAVTVASRPVDTDGGFPHDLLLGACDGVRQLSGTFTLRAWLAPYGVAGPTADQPQGSATVEVTCAATGGDCSAAHDVAITIGPAPSGVSTGRMAVSGDANSSS